MAVPCLAAAASFRAGACIPTVVITDEAVVGQLSEAVPQPSSIGATFRDCPSER